MKTDIHTELMILEKAHYDCLDNKCRVRTSFLATKIEELENKFDKLFPKMEEEDWSEPKQLECGCPRDNKLSMCINQEHCEPKKSEVDNNTTTKKDGLTTEVSDKELDKAMAQMECWHTDNHLKECKKHLANQRKEIVRKIDKYFSYKQFGSTDKLSDENMQFMKQIIRNELLDEIGEE